MASGPLQSWMDRHHLVIVKDLDDGIGGLEPEGLADPLEGHGIEVFLKGDMSIAMHLDLDPDSFLHRYIGQGLEHGFFRLIKERHRLCSRGAMDAGAGLVQHPLGQLTIGVGQVAKLSQ